MNTVLAFLEANRGRLELERHGVRGRISSVILTPRFRASSHVVFLVLQEGSPDPVLVAKVPRLREARDRVEHEVSNLRIVQARRPEGFDSIPRVVAFEDHRGWPIFVQSALVGKQLDRAAVRRDPVSACTAALHWLTEVHQSGDDLNRHGPGWYEDLVKAPLDRFSTIYPLTAVEHRALDQSRLYLESLRGNPIPGVFEHGDLSHPNLLRLRTGGLGVLDWELAEPAGLPAYDLFFFLTYVAFARSKADSVADYLKAFHEAFFGVGAWARPWVREYARTVGLESQLLTPLFLLAWLRYLMRLVLRLTAPGGSDVPVSTRTAEWLRANRYYALWQHTLVHLEELHWDDLPSDEELQQ